MIWYFVFQSLKIHGDYSEDVGVKVDRPVDETMPEGATEVVGAWSAHNEFCLCL